MTPGNKPARDLQRGDWIDVVGRKRPERADGVVTKVDTTTTPGVVYVWLQGDRTDGPASLVLNHGERVWVDPDGAPYVIINPKGEVLARFTDETERDEALLTDYADDAVEPAYVNEADGEWIIPLGMLPLLAGELEARRDDNIARVFSSVPNCENPRPDCPEHDGACD